MPLAGLSIDELAESWIQQLVLAKPLISASELYLGRTVVDAKSVANACDGKLMIISAGLGLIDGQQLSPNYQLTVVSGVGSIRPWLNSNRYRPNQWWNALNSALGNVAPISSLINEAPAGDVFLIALPSTYIELVVDDLSLVSPEKTENIRLFTSTAGVKLLPKGVSQCAMPYDDRLETLKGYSGTRSDFPQRAMLHFVQEMQVLGSSVTTSSMAVQKVMSDSKARMVPQRMKLDDHKISELIERSWETCDGSASRLLRTLRDDHLVACEQSRFSSLWRQIRNRKITEEHHD